MDGISIGILIISGINLIATFCTPIILATAYLIKRISHSDCCLGVCDIDTRDPDQASPPKRNLKKIIIISNNNIIKLNYI